MKSLLLVHYNNAACLEIILKDEATVSRKESLIEGIAIENFFTNNPLKFRVTSNRQDAYAGAEYIIIANKAGKPYRSNLFRGAL